LENTALLTSGPTSSSSSTILLTLFIIWIIKPVVPTTTATSITIIENEWTGHLTPRGWDP
jgi:hypothetical protein